MAEVLKTRSWLSQRPSDGLVLNAADSQRVSLLADLGRPPEATELLIDNRGVVDISHDPGAVHARSKHIHRRHFYVRELVQSGEFKTTFVPGDDNLADIFTKPLDTRKFLNLRARLMNLPMPRA